MAGQTADLTRMAAMALTDWVNQGNLQNAVFFKQGKYGMTPYLDLLTSSGMFDPAANTKEFGVQIKTGRNENFQYYSGYQTWKTTPIKGYDRAYFMSHQALISWSACAEELYYNGSGATKMFDVMRDIKDTTVTSLKEQLNARLLNRSTQLVVDNPGGQPEEMFTDLETIIGDELSAVTVYGSRDATTSFDWRSLIKRPGSKLPRDWKDPNGWTRDADSNVIVGGTYDGWQQLKLRDLSQMIEMLNDVYAEGYVALTTRDIMLELEALIIAETGLAPTPLNGKLSVYNYSGINYRGVEFTRDRNVPAGTIYFVHPKALRFRPIAGKWMTMRDEITPHNQDAVYGSIFVWGEQFSNERGALGKMEKIATSL